MEACTHAQVPCGSPPRQGQAGSESHCTGGGASGGRMELVTAGLEHLPLGQKKVTLLLCWVLLCGAVARVQKGLQSHSEGRAGGSLPGLPAHSAIGLGWERPHWGAQPQSADAPGQWSLSMSSGRRLRYSSLADTRVWFSQLVRRSLFYEYFNLK